MTQANGRRIGDVTIRRALEMIMPFPALQFFPETSDADWQPYLASLQPHAMDEQGHLLFPMQSYIVQTSHHTILIDSCVGNDKERPTRPPWHLKTDDTYMRALAAHGLSVEDIDFVMCTHLHTDHIGWNTRLVDGRWVPTFPNARYIFTQKEFDAWDGGHEKFSRQPYEDSVLPVVAAGRAELVNNDYALDDEIWLEPTPGHTPDHVAVNLASKGERAVFSGDLIHSPVQCYQPDWIPWPDWDAELARQTRRAFLEQCCESGILMCTAHFPLPSAGRVLRRGDAFEFEFDRQSW
jgi:glyoxylase-like metal-dependent hydrolase (beta-lactamase superfamily II)